MNELDFRTAVQGLMTHTDQPEPMDADRVLTAARQARKRRQGTVVGAGAAVAVAAVATTAVVLPMRGGDSPDVMPGVSQSPSNEPPPQTSSIFSKPPDTRPTAEPGEPAYERASKLLDVLTDVRPGGYGAPTGLRSEPDGSGDRFPLRQHMADVLWMNGDVPVWEYGADMPITKDGGTGRLHVSVITDDVSPSDPCQLAQKFWGMAGECTMVEVDGKRVGVVMKPTDDRFDQWASYRHPDGTVVHFAQAKLRVHAEGLKPLATQPYSVRELAKMATDQRFLVR